MDEARTVGKGYQLTETLGQGAFGLVRVGLHQQTHQQIAVKILDLKKAVRRDVRKEIIIHHMLQHPNVVRYLSNEEVGDHVFVMMELLPGGELFDRIEPDEGLEVDMAHLYYKQLICAVTYINNAGIAHRDIKPENILLDQFGNIKLADFGLATVFRHEGKQRPLDRKCGTPPYTSPEVLREKYSGPEADLWACGIVLVTMLAGCLAWAEPLETCREYHAWCSGARNVEPWVRIKRKAPLALELLEHVLDPNLDVRWMHEAIMAAPWVARETAITRRCNAEGLLTVEPTEWMVPEPRVIIGREEDSYLAHEDSSALDELPFKRVDSRLDVEERPVKKSKARFLSSLPIDDTLRLLEQQGRDCGYETLLNDKAGKIEFVLPDLRFTMVAEPHRKGVMVKTLLKAGDGIEFMRQLRALRAKVGAVLCTQNTQQTQTQTFSTPRG